MESRTRQPSFGSISSRSISPRPRSILHAPSSSMMAKLAHSNPLHASDNMAALPVSTYLEEPLFQTPSNKRRRLTQRVLQITGQLELLLNREQTDYVQMMMLDEKADKLTRLLKTLVAEHDEHNRPLQAYFQETGFAELFPCAMARLSLESVASGKKAHNTGIHGHFQSLTTLNQVVNICIQLQHDIGLDCHRFVPHQLTVLYQCLGPAGAEYKRYKGKIEEEFDRIKAYLAGEVASTRRGGKNTLAEDDILDAPLHPNKFDSDPMAVDAPPPPGAALGERQRLSGYHQKWLRDLTSEIVLEALYRKGPIRHASKPLATVLEC